jgi:hypothetical protein
MGNKNKGNKGKMRKKVSEEKVTPSSPGRKGGEEKRDFFDMWNDVGIIGDSFWRELEWRQNNPLK